MTEDEKKKLAARRLIQAISINLESIPRSVKNKIDDIKTASDAEKKGLPWINQILVTLGKVPESMTATKRKGKPHKKGGAIKKAKGGIVQKFSKGGTVERPRGVGIAKRGYGQVIR
jgi:hypothetical protein|tara:strand:+ start:187 stop:534 length:348 start_codon:yes stop_codon:yes gene_type:complete